MGLNQTNPDFRSGFARSTMLRAAVAVCACLFLTACNTSGKFARSVDPKYGVASSPRVVDDGTPIPKGGGYYRVGKPYTVGGKEYFPEHNPDYKAEGIASWYGDQFHGRLTANGEVFDKESISAAHTTMPIPSYARVTNLANRRSIIVRVNDRGPFHSDRIIDLSSKTADMLGFRHNGVARVRVEYVGPANIKGSDDMKLAATLRHDGIAAPAPSAVMVASGGPFVPPVQQASFPGRRMAVADVPEPPERPFDLGRFPQGSQQPVQEMPRERREPMVMAAAGGGYDRRPQPNFAYNQPGHPRPIDSPAASGRGLY